MVFKIMAIIITIMAGTPKHLIVIVVTVILVTQIIEIMSIIMKDILKIMNVINNFMTNTITKEMQIIFQKLIIILMKIIIENRLILVKIQKIINIMWW